MAARWTDAQLDAIRARRGTVLVSAAAGSGKTAVLVERVIERLTDEESPTDADRLLVVTFTKAAAAEMRERIERRLLELIREHPENARLRRQQLLLQQAQICTVDSFCSSIVREFFYLLGVAPDFSVVSDKQQEELMAEAVSVAPRCRASVGSASISVTDAPTRCAPSCMTTPIFRRFPTVSAATRTTHG